MKGILTTFFPWLLFWILLGCGMLKPSAYAALAFSAVFTAIEIKKRNLKTLQVGGFIFFLILSVFTIFLDPTWLWRWVALAGHAALAISALISIIVGKPFTIPYARERVPAKYWETPEFRRVNYVLSWLWVAAFTLMMIPPALRFAGITLKVWEKAGLSVFCFLAVLKFTYWYLRHVAG